MNAQQLIDETPVGKQTDFLMMFYPDLAKQKQADRNLTACLMVAK